MTKGWTGPGSRPRTARGSIYGMVPIRLRIPASASNRSIQAAIPQIEIGRRVRHHIDGSGNHGCELSAVLCHLPGREKNLWRRAVVDRLAAIPRSINTYDLDV